MAKIIIFNGNDISQVLDWYKIVEKIRLKQKNFGMELYEVRKWIEDNMSETIIATGPTRRGYYAFYFESETDAMAFKLRFGDDL